MKTYKYINLNLVAALGEFFPLNIPLSLINKTRFFLEEMNSEIIGEINEVLMDDYLSNKTYFLEFTLFGFSKFEKRIIQINKYLYEKIQVALIESPKNKSNVTFVGEALYFQNVLNSKGGMSLKNFNILDIRFCVRL